MADPVVVCDDRQASCRCARNPHDDGVHVCDCGGSWKASDNGSILVISYPRRPATYPVPIPEAVIEELVNA